MRKLVYGAGVSLDGYIAGPRHETDWLHWSDDVAALSAATWDAADTVLMGRRTYDVAVRTGMRAYPGVRNIVFSRTLDATEYPEVVVVAHDAVDYVQELKEQPGRDIVLMGGGQLAGSLLAAGLVDEIGVNVQPVVLGGGIPLLPDVGRRIRLRLIETRPLSGGCVYTLYRVVG